MKLSNIITPHALANVGCIVSSLATPVRSVTLGDHAVLDVLR
jgi:hypothetical protein